MTDTRWLSDDEQAAWRAFSVMQLQLTSLLDRTLRSSGLSYADYVVMAALTEHKGDRLRLRSLRRLLGWEKSRLSHQLSRMERRGLVRRDADPEDARQLVITLTPDGRRLLEAAAPEHVEVVRRHVVDLLTPEQLDTLRAASTTVLDALPEP